MNGPIILFLIAGVVVTAAAIAMVATRTMVYSAIFMVIIFLATAVIYLVYQAPFIALLQVAVYAGGIMVLFLFVIMLIGAEKMTHVETFPWQRPLAYAMVVMLAVETSYLAASRFSVVPNAHVGVDFGNPQQIGLTLFNQYLLPFEITSVLLLVALVGVIVLTKKEKG